MTRFGKPALRPEAPAAALAYVGRIIKLRVTEHDVPRYGKIKHYELDDPVLEAELLALATDVTIFPPGWGGTTDYQPFRLNYSVDESGRITRAYLG